MDRCRRGETPQRVDGVERAGQTFELVGRRRRFVPASAPKPTSTDSTRSRASTATKRDVSSSGASPRSGSDPDGLSICPLLGSQRLASDTSSLTGRRIAARGRIPAEHIESIDLLLRVDSAGASHELLDWCRDGRIRFSVGYDLTEPVRAAILKVPDHAWVSAVDQDGSARPNGQVCEITDRLEWAAGRTGRG